MRKVLTRRLVRKPSLCAVHVSPATTGEEARMKLAERARRLLTDHSSPPSGWVLQSY